MSKNFICKIQVIKKQFDKKTDITQLASYFYVNKADIFSFYIIT